MCETKCGNKPHKHAATIKAWADGAEIEYRSHIDSCWRLNGPQPIFKDDYEYRVKPQPKTPGQVYFEAAYPNGTWTSFMNEQRFETGASAVIEAYKRGELKL